MLETTKSVGSVVTEVFDPRLADPHTVSTEPSRWEV